MYCNENFRTKKALKEAVAEGRRVTVFQPGPFGADPPQNGKITLEGPHYPEPHRWYAQATLVNGAIAKVS